MTLPDEVERCVGVIYDGEWREGCLDCLRRLVPAYGPGQTWMQPPPLITFLCAYRIEPVSPRDEVS